MQMILTILVLLPLTQGTNELKITPIKNAILPIELRKSKVIYTKYTFLHYVELNDILEQLNKLKMPNFTSPYKRNY